MEWKIGCSGYHYNDWKGVFFPADLPQREWLAFYAKHFNTLELNTTYYKFPRVDLLKRWAEMSPESFTFTVKAPRQVTGFKKFKEAQQTLTKFNQTVREGFGEKLGCVLFQFPADFEYEQERLTRITETLDVSLRNVVEFRHASWWQPAVYDALSSANISFCGLSHPMLPGEVIRTTETIYYRFHGIPHLYTSRYDIQKLEQTVQQISARGGRQAFVTFNNTADGHAVINAKELQNVSELVH